MLRPFYLYPLTFLLFYSINPINSQRYALCSMPYAPVPAPRTSQLALLTPHMKLHMVGTANRRISNIEPQNIEGWNRFAQSFLK